jgi:Lon protease-like protein
MNLLPLFPLDVVLLPGTPLPLHIFEPRYKEMIGECLQLQSAFGVIRAKEDGIEEVGCTAEILTVTKEYADGRMDIVTQGGTRFEVVAVNGERSFLQAEVLFLEDEPGQASKDEITRAVELHNEILRLAGATPIDPKEVEATGLSFRLAGALPLDLDFKQDLLKLKSEAERLQALTRYFETILPNLRRTIHIRRKASGNGHG